MATNQTGFCVARVALQEMTALLVNKGCFRQTEKESATTTPPYPYVNSRELITDNVLEEMIIYYRKSKEINTQLPATSFLRWFGTGIGDAPGESET